MRLLRFQSFTKSGINWVEGKATLRNLCAAFNCTEKVYPDIYFSRNGYSQRILSIGLGFMHTDGLFRCTWGLYLVFGRMVPVNYDESDPYETRSLDDVYHTGRWRDATLADLGGGVV